MEQNIFGPHLTLDLNGCDPSKLSNLDLIFNLLDSLPERMGMTKITQPYVFKYSGLIPDDVGITGFVVIAESHLSIHTFQKKEYAFIDIFSCKPFDYKCAERYIIDVFDSKKHTSNLVMRGLDFKRGPL